LLQNLISNALKYTNSGKILVGCRRSGSQICIEVLDTGIGIALKDKQSVFKEFKRLREGISSAPGLGLGLSIVERISGRLGHKVGFESEPGKGTRFKVFVERTIGTSDVTDKTPSTAPFVNNIIPGMKVLCVDNDASVLSGLSSLLQQWNCEVLTAASSDEATRSIEAQGFVPDIVLMDYHLNEETGIDAILRLRQIFGDDMRAVLVTTERSQSLKKIAEFLDLTFINKPVKPAALRSVLASVGRVSQAAE
jgi:CheY-like chemotaxis protein